MLSVVEDSWADQYVQQNNKNHVNHAAPVVQPEGELPTGGDGAASGSSNGMRMLLLSTGGKLSYTVSGGKVYASALELARLKGCAYAESSHTFAEQGGGVIYGALKDSEVITAPSGGQLVELGKAAKLLGLTFTQRDDGRVVVRGSQTAAELRSAVNRVVQNKEYRKYETFIGKYYWIEYAGTEIVGNLLDFEWITSAFKKLTGQYDQEKFDEGFGKIILHSGSYEQAVKSYKDIESAIADPLNMFNWFEDAVNKEDGELFKLMKRLGDSDYDAALKVRQWGNLFYEAVYSDPVTAGVLEVADVWEGISDIEADQYAREL
ncbi:MAG: hypothetical protein IJ343_14745, partial [Clostridia bacterium]|nr:hypothetical protein [Clostridia bacterium]